VRANIAILLDEGRGTAEQARVYARRWMLDADDQVEASVKSLEDPAMASSWLSILEQSSSALQDVAAEKGWAKTQEGDFQRAIESAASASSGSIQLDSWPAVGPVDVVLPGNTGVELKWCKTGDKLANCVWDIAKLATAIAEEKLAYGLIAAGAPDTHWATNSPGVALFTPGEHDTPELVRNYEGWWRFWCKDVMTRPTRLPQTIRIVDTGGVPVPLDGVPFTLRLASVEVLDATWRDHVCPHRWRGEECRPRPWDPEGATP
jgi:hypothetical protein